MGENDDAIDEIPDISAARALAPTARICVEHRVRERT